MSEIISGILKCTSGKIVFNGVEIQDKSIKEIRHLGLSHISEDRIKYGIANTLSVRDNIASIYLSSGEFNKGPFLNVRKLNKFVDDCIKEFEIACSGGQDKIRYLSGG